MFCTSSYCTLDTNAHLQNKHIRRVHIIIAKQWCLLFVMIVVEKQMLGYTRNESSMIQQHNKSTAE